MWTKVYYENLDFDKKEETYYFQGDYSKHPQSLEQTIFHHIHRYHGNHENGHGRFKYRIEIHNRRPDDFLEKRISSLRREIESTHELIEKYEKEKDTKLIVLDVKLSGVGGHYEKANT